MLVASFFICLILFNVLSMIAAKIVEKPVGVPGLLAYTGIMVWTYPKCAEFKKVFEEPHAHGYGYGIGGRIGSIITDKANNWDWVAVGATGAILVYGFFAVFKSIERHGYHADGIYNDGFEPELSEIVKLLFYGVAVLLACLALYKLFA